MDATDSDPLFLNRGLEIATPKLFFIYLIKIWKLCPQPNYKTTLFKKY